MEARKWDGRLPSALPVTQPLLPAANVPLLLIAQGAQKREAPTVDVGDRDADVVGILLCHGGLQRAGFLDKVRCFVGVRVGICHQCQQNLGVKKPSGKQFRRSQMKWKNITSKIKGRATC